VSLPAAFLDELRARTGLAGVVGRRVKLVRAGREMKGCCPFHHEKTPSFYVNEEKGFYHCFGCGAHGDAIGFLMASDGLAFMDSVKALAAEAGLAMPEPARPDPADAARAGLHELLAAAADWFRVQLGASAGADARAYLGRRGVSAETVATFALGFAPDRRDALSAALTSQFPAMDPQRLLDAGLAGESDPEPGVTTRRYDRFRGRLMFPIHDARGRVVGFGGRALGDAQPKYLNSPEGPVFHKGSLLYNFHRAAPAARKAGRLIVVEGYMDVVGLAGAGIAEAVAPLGTALGEEQMALAWKLVAEPCLAFDGDAAGTRAALRAAIRALPLLAPGRSLAFASLPAGQDPDDLARTGGAPAVEALCRQAVPLERFLFAAEVAAGPLDTPERRAALRARLKALAGAIGEEAIRRDYLATWLGRADALFRPVRRAWGQRPGATPKPPLLPATRAAGIAGEEGRTQLLAEIARRGAAERHAESLAQLPLASPTAILWRDRLLAGKPVESLLRGYGVKALRMLDDRAFDDMVTEALASLAATHHIRAEMREPRDLSDEAMARDWEQRRLLLDAEAAARRRLAGIGIGPEGV